MPVRSQTPRSMDHEPPSLLITVRSAAELRQVLPSGCSVAVWDVKEPRHGALGRPDQTELDAIADCWTREFLSSGRPTPGTRLSLAAGELAELERLANRDLAQLRRCIPVFDFVKVGLAGEAVAGSERADWPARIGDCRHRLGIRRMIVVAYADHRNADSPPIEQVARVAVKTACHGLLIDTFEKRPGVNLFSYCRPELLHSVRERVKQDERLFAIAGSLTQRDLAAAVDCHPDLIGMRGGICRGGRESAIDPRKIAAVAEALDVVKRAGRTRRGPARSLGRRD